MLSPAPNPKDRSAGTAPLDLLGANGSRVQAPDTPATILLIDAAMPRRRSVAAVLQGLGHRFVECRDTTQALDYLSHQRTDLVIVDLLAPEIGAAGMCRVLREAVGSQMLPVIAIARRGTVDHEVAALDAGADTVLPATVHPRALRACVQSSLRRKASVEALDETETVLFTLAQSVEERDPALGQHCGRLALMGAAMGVALGLDAESILALQRGGYLHDVGKVAIPDSVLFKPGPLTDDEWVIMKSHPERGERICRNVRSLAPVLPIIRSHHERWDGSGYPDGLRGEQIPLLARIVQLADIYDALTTARPYKPAFRPEDALRILQDETNKGWRDPKLMKTFVDLLPLFQSGTASDVAELSLQSLATSIERYRKDPAYAQHLHEEGPEPGPVRLVSGL